MAEGSGRYGSGPGGVGGRGTSPLARVPDAVIDRLLGGRLGMRLFFFGMRRLYKPERSGGFRGEIEFTFGTARGHDVWTFECLDGGCAVRHAPAPNAAVRVRSRLADFVRIAVGDLDAGRAMVTGRLGIRGDFGVAVRIGEMFGGKPFV